MAEIDEQVPEQQTGAETNTSYSFDAEDKETAVHKYELVKMRMLDIDHWHDYAGTGTATFRLMNESGEPTDDRVREGFFFRIDIPGPGSSTGEGYDWVKIECVEETGSPEMPEQAITIRVRPCSNPGNDKKDTAHFYSSEATSNFMVKREGKRVTAFVLGRNEKPNVGADSVLDKTRNAAIGLTAAAGLSTIQWNRLVKGLINEQE